MFRVTHLITGLDTGGAELALARLLAARSTNGFEHSVVSLTTRGTIGDRIVDLGVPVHALGLTPMAAPMILIKLTRLLKQLRPDVLQTWLYHADAAGTLAAFLAGVPHIAWNIRGADFDPRAYRRSLSAILRLLAMASSVPAVVVSNSYEGRAAHERLGYHPKRWEIIPNGVDSALFQPSARARECMRRRLGLGSSTRLVGHLARYHPMKDHVTFLRAVAVVTAARQDVHVIAAGRGVADDAALAQEIASLRLGGRVTLLGEQSQPAEFLAACDVFALSSAYGEGFPNVVAEAMACGVPCVVTNVGDAARIVGDAGIVVETRNPESLARGILEYLNMGPADADAAADAARRRIVEHYSLERAIAHYESLYREIAGVNAA